MFLKKVLKLMWLSGLIGVVTGCATQPAHYQKATVKSGSKAWQQKIQVAIAPFFDGRTVPLSKTVFVDSPDLIIRRAPIYTPDGYPLNQSFDTTINPTGNALEKNSRSDSPTLAGSRISTPDGTVTFTLLKKGEACFIRHNQSNQKILLRDSDCSVLDMQKEA